MGQHRRSWPNRKFCYAVTLLIVAVVAATILQPRSQSNGASRPRAISAKKRSHSAPSALASVDEINARARKSRSATSAVDETDARAVRPLWRCRESQVARRSGVAKLGFVHVFKAAGSTLSTLFEGYSGKCHAGYGRLVNCNSIDPKSIRSGRNWRNCTLKFAYRRSGDYAYTDYEGKVNNTYLGRHLDIIGGHQRLGSLDYLLDASGKRTGDLRYVTFVRDAAAKFVSGVVFVMSKKDGVTPRDIVEYIYEHVERNAKKGGYHIKYANYFLTPTQAERWKRKKHKTGHVSMEETTEMIMKNLVKYNVVIGAVERMSESIEMLHHLIDPDGDATDLFVDYGMRLPNAEGRNKGGHGEKSATETKHNASPLSASEVLRVLRKDEKFGKKLLEYVKFEQQITDFAMEIHMRQYNAMQEMKRISSLHKGNTMEWGQSRA